MTGNIIYIIPLTPLRMGVNKMTYHCLPTHASEEIPSSLIGPKALAKLEKIWKDLEPEDLPLIASTPMPHFYSPDEIQKAILISAAQAWLAKN
jgi:hypothetical protein